MKNGNKLFAAFIIGSFFLQSCHIGHDHSEEGHDHAHEEHEHHEGDADVAQLTTEQVSSLKMKVGAIPTRNIGAYIEANGQLEVPPQNEALVSTYIGANVASIEVIEGDHVSKGKVLAYLSHPEIIKVQTDYLEAFNSVTFLEKEYLRKKTLYEENVGSGKELERVEAEFLTARGRSNGYEAQLRLLGINVEGVRNGNIEERIPIRSPIEGSIRKVEVKTGQYVEPRTDLFDIVNVEHIHADLMVFEKDIDKVSVNQKVYFSLEGHEEYDLEAYIYAVGKAFENEPKAVHLHAEIENKHGLLIPGMYVRGRIMQEERMITALPEDAIVNEGGKNYAFSLADTTDGTWLFEPTEVEVGERYDNWVGVTLLTEQTDGDVFALNNAYYLMAQMKKGEAGHEH